MPSKQTLICWAAVLLIVAACGGAAEEPAATAEAPAPTDVPATTASSDTTEPPATTEAPADLTDVSLRVDWFISGQQAPFFVARELGFYEAAGLNVDIIEGSGSSDGAKLAGTDEVDFAVIDASVLLTARAEGIPIQSVAALYQRSPISVFWLEDNVDISSPADLENGIRLGINERSAHAVAVEALFIVDDTVSKENVDIVPVGFDVQPLLEGQIDAMGGFSNVEPPILEHEGENVGQLFMADYGVDLYGLTIVTHDDRVANEPDLVKALVTATMQGWQASLDDPEGAIEILLANHPEGDEELDGAILDATLALAENQDTEEHGLGWQNPQIWEDSINIMSEIGFLDAGAIAPEDVFSNVAFE